MTAPDNLVPKVHPLERDVALDDPFELVATTAVGDPEVMLECILQEFLWMGWDTEQLLRLFENPEYPLLCTLQQLYGPVEVRRRVEELVARGGRLRVSEFIAEPDVEFEPEPELVQISFGQSIKG